MKRKNVLRLVLAGSAVSCMVLGGISVAIGASKDIKSAEASSSEFTPEDLSKVTTINLNDCTDTEIRNYYSALDGKSSSELSGTNLLKNLKGVLQNNVSYFKYDKADEIYVITDRDWVNSPASGISGYNSSTNTITGFSHSSEAENNPYLHLLYCNYAVQGKTAYNNDGDVSSTSKSFDKEHVWSQSHGFDDGTTSGSDLTGAGSDLHHLLAGAQYGNRTLHSSYSYGFVKANDGDWSSKTYETLNKRGAPLFSHSGDEQTKVFEPQDSDKGDIARALLYMVACYNEYDGGTITPANPALELVNYVIKGGSGGRGGHSSVDRTNGYYGVLQDILAWHRLDPVDEYEIHRNNLIYRNYQHNRNPFIDYPEWVDYIWGVSEYDANAKTISYDSTCTGYVDLEQDEINGYRTSTRALVKIEVTTGPTKDTYYVGEEFDKTGMVVTATYDDDSTQNVTRNCVITGDTSVAGTRNVNVTYKDKACTTTITVLPCEAAVESVTLNRSSAIIAIGSQLTLNAVVSPINAMSKQVIWSSSNTSKATVTNGIVTGVAETTDPVVITATSAIDSTKKATCEITVRTAVPKVTITDTLTVTDTGVTGSTYTNWSNVVKSSGTTYAGISSKGNNVISINANNNAAGYAGIYNSASVGLIKKVTLTWQSNTAANRTVNVYGNDEAFSSPADMVNGSGTLIGTIVYGTSTELVITDEYEYIGIRAIGGNAYLTEVKFTWEKESTTEEIPVTGISMSQHSLNLTKGDSSQLVASVEPAEATNPSIDFSSSSPSVAMVTSEGLVTALEVGTTTITAETEDGGFTATCTVTVVSSSVGTEYFEKQTSASSVTSGQYVICANVNGTYYPMKTYVNSNNYIASSTPVTVANNKISLNDAHGSIVTVTKSTSTITIKLNENNYLVMNSGGALYYSTTATNWTFDSGENGTFRVSAINGTATRVLAYRASGERFALYAASNVTSGSSDYYDVEFFKYTEDSSAQYVLDNFVSDFLTKITCDATGATAPTFATGYSWSELATKFNSLTTTEKNEMKTLVADKNGNNKEICAAKYDLLVSKYGYNNFMDRTIVPHSNIINNIKTNNVIIMVVAVSMISMSSAAFFIFRKKKER